MSEVVECGIYVYILYSVHISVTPKILNAFLLFTTQQTCKYKKYINSIMKMYPGSHIALFIITMDSEFTLTDKKNGNPDNKDNWFNVESMLRITNMTLI